ncbi:MAG: hypothetical protein AB7L66_13500 [Gemmatimonadales bacterium]
MVMALWLSLVSLQQGAVPLDQGWELSGNGTRIETHSGRQAIRIVNGRAIRRDVRLEDGTIEYDMEVSPYRGFAYVQFRMESDRDFEEIYFRPHKSGLPDGIQYNPVWRGDSFWQLWHGPDASGLPRFRHREWMHVRVVLQGRRAAVFLDRSPTPVMVANLARDPRGGYLALRGFNADSDFPDEPVAW